MEEVKTQIPLDKKSEAKEKVGGGGDSGEEEIKTRKQPLQESLPGCTEFSEYSNNNMQNTRYFSLELVSYLKL
jgi:hypothetical protein